MILDHDEVTARLDSPNNLFNKLRGLTHGDVTELSSSLVSNVDDFIRGVTSPNEPLVPELTDLIPDAEYKLQENLIKQKAEDVLLNTLDELRFRLAEVEKPEKLSKIAADMGKLLSLGSPKDIGRGNTNVIIYKPAVNHESHYEQVAVNE